MPVHHFTATSDACGVVHLDVPTGRGQFEVHVVVIPASEEAQLLESAEERGWPPGYFEKVYGSITDDSFVAPDRAPPMPEPA